jgi:uncharacterized circularly permuted ATP-grasp superfamily protein
MKTAYYRESLRHVWGRAEPQLKRCWKDTCSAFTEHPESTNETYLQHLWFTLTMGIRLAYTAVVLIIHGVFPFLLERTASKRIEVIYRIMKSRITPARRTEIDTDYTI